MVWVHGTIGLSAPAQFVREGFGAKNQSTRVSSHMRSKQPFNNQIEVNSRTMGNIYATNKHSKILINKVT